MTDIIVVGGGSNSLTTACYLAKAGLDVLVLERNSQAGGGVVSVEAAPGFINDPHAMGFITLQGNPIIQDDELELFGKYGLVFKNNKSPFGSLFSDDSSLVSYQDVDITCSEIAKHSANDAVAYKEFVEEVSKFLPLLITGFYAPPMPEEGFYSLLEESDEGKELLRFLSMSPMDILNERFESEVVKMHFAKWCTEMMIAPTVKGAGIAIVLILSMCHRYPMSTVVGGAKELTNSLIRCLEDHGGKIYLGRTVKKLVMEGNKCVGVEMDSGEVIRAKKAVVGNIHPWRLGDFIDGLDPELVEKAKAVRLSDFGTFNQQLALSEVPQWKAGVRYNEITTLEILKKDFDGFLNSFDTLAKGEMPFDHLAPLVNVQSNIDETRAPKGQAAVYLYHFAPFHINGGWENRKEEVADAIFDWFASFTTNIDKSKLIGRYAESPADHAKHSMNMMHGDIMGCAMGYGQIMGARPIPELADYTVPGISSLYLAGPMQHPGGTVTLGGRATAIKMFDDMGIPLQQAFTTF